VLRAVNGERLGVSSLIALGDWAAAALDATPGFTAPMIERALASMQREVAVAWRTARRIVHAVVIEDRPTLDSALATMRTQRVPLVLSLRVPWSLKHTVARDAPEVIGNA